MRHRGSPIVSRLSGAPAPPSGLDGAGEETILPGRIPDAILGRFSYDVDACRALTNKDRSSIYGGFHLYVLKG